MDANNHLWHIPLMVCLAVAVLASGSACQSPSSKSVYQQKYGVKPVSTIEAYQKRVSEDANQALVNLRQFVSDAVFDIVYATSSNFMGRPVYHQAGAYLRLPAARALRAVQQELDSLGYGLKIWDGYRPYRVTVDFYEYVQDSTFAASPYTGSRHNRGCAIDVTLINKATGEEIAMPTLFDEFVPEAHVSFVDLPEEVLQNRELLIGVMAKHGFRVYEPEWWHYDFEGWEQYDLLDLEFEELASVID